MLGAALPVTSGLWCPKNASLSASYSLTAPSTAYVAQPVEEATHTRLCKVSTNPCPAGSTYPFGTTIEAKASDFKIVTSISTLTCKEVAMVATTNAVGAEPLPFTQNFTFSNCNYPGIGACAVSSAPATGSVKWTGKIDGTFTLKNVSWQFSCTAFYTCTYGGTLSGSFYGTNVATGEPAKMVFTNLVLENLGGSCQPVNKMSATFAVSAPSPVFVS